MSLKHVAIQPVGHLTTAKEISLSKNIPFDVTSRVLQIMAREKILESIQGVQGGYKLSRSPAAISLFELGEMIEGPLGLVRCLSATNNECEFIGTCNVHSPLSVLNKKMLEFCKTISVAEMIGVAPPQKSIHSMREGTL